MSGVLKGSAGRPKHATTEYFGHGLCIETLPASDNSELDRLREENVSLEEQLQYARQLLDIWQQQPCPLCQVQASAANSNNRLPNSRTKSRSSTSSRNSDQSNIAPSPVSSGSSSTVQGSLGKAFRQQQVLIAQLQRQVLVLQTELTSRDALVLEADTILAEACRRLVPLLALQDSSTLSTPTATAPAGRQKPAVLRAQTSSRPASRQTAAAPGTAAGLVAGSKGMESYTAAVSNQISDQAQGLLTWCRSTIARIDSVRAQSAAQCRAARDSCSNANSATGTSGSHERTWESDIQVPSSLQQLQLQYIAAGGNRHLRSGSSPTLPGIAAGSGAAVLNTAALFQLIPQLASLAQSLAYLSVQLRTIILPALPWVAVGAVDQQLMSSTEATAAAAAAAVGQLVEACSLLPAVAGNLSGAAAATARRSIVQQAGASQIGDCYHGHSNDNVEEPVDDAAVEQLLGLDDAIGTMLNELVVLLSIPGQTAKGGRSAGAAATSRVSNAGRSPGKPHGQWKQDDDTIYQALDKLRHEWRALALKKLALEQQLGFVAKCSTEQAKLISRLTQDVATALAAAVDEAEMQDDMQERRQDALQLVQQLQRVMLLLQQRPGDGGGSAVRTLIGLLQQHWEVLGDLPHLLYASSAPALKASALAAVTAAFEDFRASMHVAKCDADTCCRRLKAVSISSTGGNRGDRACV